MADISVNLTNPLPDPTVALPQEDFTLPRPEAVPFQDPFQKAPDDQPLELDDLKKTADQMNAAMEVLNQRYRFGIYQDTDQFYVQVLDAGSGRVLRTKPVQELLELHRRLQEMVGLVVDEEL